MPRHRMSFKYSIGDRAIAMWDNAMRDCQVVEIIVRKSGTHYLLQCGSKSKIFHELAVAKTASALGARMTSTTNEPFDNN